MGAENYLWSFYLRSVEKGTFVLGTSIAIEFFYGMLLTIFLVIMAFSLSLLLGCGNFFLILLGATDKRFYVFTLLGSIYTIVFRSIPELLVILVIYYGLTPIFISLVRESPLVFPLCAGSVALGLIFGAYVSEIFRSSLKAIPKGYIEAAEALGLKKFVIYRKIVFPGVWKHSLPALSNIFLILLKDTALISAIGVNELMSVSVRYVQSMGEPMIFYSIAAGIYLLLTFLGEKLFVWQKKKYSRGM